ncbi:MAG: acyltransferase [Candidatus Eremiobacteraeota bacterium]|nr:acyltransferase [Candidatus Eremiobacteraeota bacterium]
MTEPRRDKLDALTSLRFFASLLVFSWHCVPTHQVSATFSLGYVGVGFFFLLSGFILTYSYRAAFAAELRADAVRAFYVARFARIVPLHLVTMPPMILTMVYFGNPLWTGVGTPTRITEVAAQAVLLQSWFAQGAVHFGGNGPSWSISVEAFFYALFPVLAFAMLRAFRSAKTRAVLAAAFAVWLMQLVVLSPQHASVDDWRFYVFPPARLADFVVGMLLGIAVLRGDPAGRWRLRGTSMEMLAVTAVGLSVVVSPLLPLALRFSSALMPAWAFAIYVFAARRGAISRVLEHPLLVRLGEVSFAFYLIHLAVIVSVTHWLGTSHPLFLLLAFGVTLGLSVALFHIVEQPMRIRIRRAFEPAGVRRSARPSGGERTPRIVVPAVEQRGFHVQPGETV